MERQRNPRFLRHAVALRIRQRLLKAADQRQPDSIRQKILPAFHGKRHLHAGMHFEFAGDPSQGQAEPPFLPLGGDRVNMPPHLVKAAPHMRQQLAKAVLGLYRIMVHQIIDRIQPHDGGGKRMPDRIMQLPR
ncbi:hypothetical protein D3C81_1277820 [compost metagenome]